MNVVRLVEFRNRGLVATLKDILALAEGGQLRGAAFVLKLGPGDHRAGISGDYKRFPEEALRATYMMERHLHGAIPPTFEESQL